MTTNRLQLLPLSPADAPFIRELVNSPAWLQYIGDRNVRTDADALRYLEERIFPDYEVGPIMNWKVCLLTDGTPIGNCGFYRRGFTDFPDLGFAFLPAYTKQGYGYEAASACLRFARQQLNVEKICAITTEDNIASIALLKKLGFVQNGTVFWPDDPEELLLFELKLFETSK
ncbi:MAG: GNAT family N-acetyltransferase [Bacteroidota bacterium]